MPPYLRLLRRLLAAFSLLCALPLFTAAAEEAREDIQAIRDEIEAESKCYAAPGPEGSRPRAICVWRPAIAGSDKLPTLYMADGMIGIYVAAIPLKRAMEAGTIAPAMIVGIDPQADPEDRAAEYVDHFHGPRSYNAHETWVITYVIPWAERTRGAAADPAQRYIGGFSNGADWAATMAGSHTDLFAGALIHSPMMMKTKTAKQWKGLGSENLRWVVTGGTEEVSGTVKPKAELPKKLARVLDKTGAEVRSCFGRWEHEGRAWRRLSGGSITWLMQLGDPALVESDVEQSSCKTTQPVPEKS
jgi:enterochelin esterase-like enzyme